ncbi:Presenilin-1, partial [Rhizopus stolonifer]
NVKNLQHSCAHRAVMKGLDTVLLNVKKTIGNKIITKYVKQSYEIDKEYKKKQVRLFQYENVYSKFSCTDDIPLNDLSNDKEEEESFAEDLIFYTNQIYRVIKPVVACIILSIFWVKVSFSGQSDYSPSRPNYISISTTSTSTTSSATTSIGSSFITAAVIIAQIIAVTIIIVFLFKKGWIKVLIGFFMVVVLLLLGFMTYLLLLNLIQVFIIPMDYITLIFALWNFAVVGLISIFWKGPLWLQQCYLTIMSSLMAFSLTGLEQWTTWILLGLLAIW